MSTLTALKLERELEVARRSMAGRPKLAMQWSVDPHTGRPTAVWTAEHMTEIVAEMPVPVLD